MLFSLISEEERVAEEVVDEEEEQNFQPTAKIGAKKQKKLEEKQAKKAQREVKVLKGSVNCQCPVSAAELRCVLAFSGRDGRAGGEEEDAGAQGAGETTGRRERAAGGTETG